MGVSHKSLRVVMKFNLLAGTGSSNTQFFILWCSLFFILSYLPPDLWCMRGQQITKTTSGRKTSGPPRNVMNVASKI